ncbi:esterase-like activity of phytase family protein [Nocardioides sp. R1-1]|uniref:esterase-like activity of phytase family protein n=1 Tax=Nocardioides sp. R1-1 TaxID=3383502 RepID=UPI0038D1B5AC
MVPRRRALLVSALLSASALLGPGAAPGSTAGAPDVRLLGVTTLPSGMRYAGTTVGGLSGIDRDPRRGDYVLISNDRSELAPARFYTARITLDGGAPDVALTGRHILLRDDAMPYPSLTSWLSEPCRQGEAVCERRATVDPEDVRVDPRSGTVWWSQEGDRQTGPVPFLSDPSIRRAERDGGFAGQMRVPEMLRVDAGPRGPRANLGLEAFTFAACGRLVTSVVEGPLLQDGPEPTATEGALARLSVQSRGGTLRAQYAYPMDAVDGTPGANGVAAILEDPRRPGRYLVLERAVVLGAGTRVRLYAVTLPAVPGARGAAGEWPGPPATDIAGIDALADLAPGRTLRPLHKELVADLADLGVEPGIVEGMTWGPGLPTGERSLLLVADDNFALRAIPGVAQVSQLIALAVDDASAPPAASC